MPLSNKQTQPVTAASDADAARAAQDDALSDSKHGT
jgi:hypothetical protein